MPDASSMKRVRAVLRGDCPDRIPVSFYQHHHDKEREPRVLVSHLLEFNRRYNWDFVKIQSRPSYYAEAWGCKFRWGNGEPPEMHDYVIKDVTDFKSLRPIPSTEGVFAEHVEVAKLLNDELAGTLPFVQTTLSPLAVATRLAGSPPRAPSEAARMKDFMRREPAVVHQALSVIAMTLAEYARASVKAGADGMFMTTSVWATRNTITESEYEEFGKPYDMEVFGAAKEAGGWFNILHICKDNVMFDLLSDYPVSVINWDACLSRNPTLLEALDRTDKVLWAGIDQKGASMLGGLPEDVKREVKEALDGLSRALNKSGGKRILLGPGCVIPPQVPRSHIDAAMESIHSWSGRTP